MVINDKTTIEGSPSERSKMTNKKTAKKSSKSTLEKLRELNPISGMGAIGLACIDYLQLNMGKEFTSY